MPKFIDLTSYLASLERSGWTVYVSECRDPDLMHRPFRTLEHTWTLEEYALVLHRMYHESHAIYHTNASPLADVRVLVFQDSEQMFCVVPRCKAMPQAVVVAVRQT